MNNRPVNSYHCRFRNAKEGGHFDCRFSGIARLQPIGKKPSRLENKTTSQKEAGSGKTPTASLLQLDATIPFSFTFLFLFRLFCWIFFVCVCVRGNLHNRICEGNPRHVANRFSDGAGTCWYQRMERCRRRAQHLLPMQNLPSDNRSVVSSGQTRTLNGVRKGVSFLSTVSSFDSFK